jgi:hypothetical protein
MRIDVLPDLTQQSQVDALNAGVKHLVKKYHLRNFSFQCLPQGEESVIEVIKLAGFDQQARLRDYRRLTQAEFSDIIVFNKIVESTEEPMAAGEQA